MRTRTGKIFCPSARGINKRQLAKGIKVEMEHTRSPAAAKCIALAHLHEHERYYIELAKMERKLEKKGKRR